MLEVMNLKFLLLLSKSAVNSFTSKIILNIAVHILKETSRALDVNFHQMVIFTAVAGTKVSDMEQESVFTRMDQFIKVLGLMVNGVLMDLVGSVCIKICKER